MLCQLRQPLALDDDACGVAVPGIRRDAFLAQLCLLNLVGQGLRAAKPAMRHARGTMKCAMRGIRNCSDFGGVRSGPHRVCGATANHHIIFTPGVHGRDGACSWTARWTRRSRSTTSRTRCFLRDAGWIAVLGAIDVEVVVLRIFAEDVARYEPGRSCAKPWLWLRAYRCSRSSWPRRARQVGAQNQFAQLTHGNLHVVLIDQTASDASTWLAATAEGTRVGLPPGVPKLRSC